MASLAGAVLVLLPARVIAEPNIVTPPPRAAEKEVAGTLMIVGGGKLPDAVRDRFVELAGGKKGRLVVIPTASALDAQNKRSFNYWKKQDLASVDMLDTLDPKKANDPEFVKPLKEATAVWLGGGDQSRLADAYRGTAVEHELRSVLARGGVIGGTSAGASVMSSVMITGGNPLARVGVGFGLLPDVVIDQHFHNRNRQQRLLGVLKEHPSCVGLGIDESTAVVVRGHTFTVVGNANVSVCLPPLAQEPASVTKVLKSGEPGELLLARLKTASETKTASKEPSDSAHAEVASKQHSAP